MPPIKEFMDDTTLIMNRKKVVQNTLDKLNNLLGWCRMPAKSRNLALVRGKIRRDVLDVAEQRIPIVSEEPLKSLGRVFDESLTDKSMGAPFSNKPSRNCKRSRRRRCKGVSKCGCSSSCSFQDYFSR